MWNIDVSSLPPSRESALVKFGRNIWNFLTWKHTYRETPRENNVVREWQKVLARSKTERWNLKWWMSLNTYTAWERLSPQETAQKIQNIFGQVENVRIPRSNGTIEVASRRADGLFYFSGKNTPCYLDKGETASKNLEQKESQVSVVQKKSQRRVDAILPKDQSKENRIEVSQSRAPSLWNIYSAPYEFGDKHTLCSRTAARNLSRLLWSGVAPTGDARDVYNKYPDLLPNMVAPYQRGRPGFNPPENANVADIFIDTGSEHGHRVAAYVNNSQWFVLCPYYFWSKQTYPKPINEYLAAVGKPIWWIGYYRRESRVA